MKLDKNYEITSDRYNWVLNYESDPYEATIAGKTKMVTSKDTCYFPTLQGCLKAYVDKSLKDLPQVDEVLSKLSELHKVIDNVKKDK